MEEDKKEDLKEKKSNKKVAIFTIVVIAIIVIAVCVYCLVPKNEDNNVEQEQITEDNTLNNENNEDEDIIANTEETTDENSETNNQLENEINQNTTNTIASSENKITTKPKEESTNTTNNKVQNTTNNNINNSSSNKTQNTTSNKVNNPTKNEEKTNSTTANKTESKPTFVKTETNKELTNTQTKYGVVISTYTTTTYNVYSDGSKTVKSTSTNTEYDKSKYKATTSELLTEARQLKNSNASLINGALKYTNQYREEANTKAINGVTNRTALTLDSNLSVAACARAMEMAYGDKFSHTRPNGSSCFTVLDEMGISYMSCAENIAYGYSSAQSVSNGWKNSSGHYANMIGASYSKIGIGVINFQGTYYWVQLFTN